MNVLMLTNTYLPHVGGVARSVASFTERLRRLGHAVLVVAPTFPDMPAHESGVVRVPALQRFNGSDFSVRLPVPMFLAAAVDRFDPAIVHSHHPFLLGDTALRIAATRNLPIVFTHHTMYERYTHYVPGDSPVMKRFVIRMATDYANLCDRVIAPSESIAAVLRTRGVETPLRAIPTGIDVEHFARGDRQRARARWGIPGAAFVVGHVGRLAPEKNLPFLARAVARLLRRDSDVHFLVVGGGRAESDLRGVLAQPGMKGRVHLTGPLQGGELVDAYHAMDVFAFASQSETQGMVLAEAMAAAVPVVAVDAPGVREVVRDGVNGRLLASEDEAGFAAALRELAGNGASARRVLAAAAAETARSFSLEHCTERLLEVYGELVGRETGLEEVENTPWEQTLRLLETEWVLWSRRAGAVVDSISEHKA